MSDWDGSASFWCVSSAHQKPGVHRVRMWVYAVHQSLHTQTQWASIGMNVSGLATWVTTPARGYPAPDCRLAPYTRDNHLGNIYTGYPASYNWTLPTWVPTAERCAFRLRCVSAACAALRLSITTIVLGACL